MIKYWAYVTTIRKVEIAKETPTQVVRTDGHREAKRSDYGSYHDTWEESRDYLIAKAREEVVYKQDALAVAKKRLAKAEAIPETEPA